MKYYKKNWLQNTYINFIDITDQEYFIRTNNYLENFHKIMNENIEVYHPKLAYLIYKYKNFLISVYSKLKDSFVLNIPPKREKFSVINDIYKFISNYNKKYSNKININHIIQGDKEDLNIIYKITYYMLDLLYNMDLDESDGNKPESSDNEDQNENNINEDDIIEKYEEELEYISNIDNNSEKEDVKEDSLYL